MNTPQLSLFSVEDPARSRPAKPAPELTELGSRLPSWIHFGTSSFTFPGWGRDLVFAGAPSKDDLVFDGLAAYTQHPLLRTVGIDRSFYGPLTAHDLARYRTQLAPGYPLIFKVWEEITTRVIPNHPRYGARAGQVNPHFLDSGAFAEVLAPHLQELPDNTGAFVFELTPAPKSSLPPPKEFARELATFFSNIPKGPRYAVELRNAELLSASYFSVLREHGVAHVLNYWTAMPTVGEQLMMPDVLTADFVIARLMLPPFTRYEELKAKYEPFDRIVYPDPDMRSDVIHLLEHAAEKGLSAAFVIVNNKAEGSAPLTCFDLAERAAALPDYPPPSLPPTPIAGPV